MALAQSVSPRTHFVDPVPINSLLPPCDDCLYSISGEVRPMDIIQALLNIRDQLPAATIITFDADNHSGRAQRYMRYDCPRLQLCSTYGAMGDSLHNSECVFLTFVGVSGFMISGQEQKTAIQHAGRPNGLILQQRQVRQHLNAPRARTSQTGCQYRYGQFRFLGHGPSPERLSRSRHPHRRARPCIVPIHPGLVVHSDRAINRSRTQSRRELLTPNAAAPSTADTHAFDHLTRWSLTCLTH